MRFGVSYNILNGTLAHRNYNFIWLDIFCLAYIAESSLQRQSKHHVIFFKYLNLVHFLRGCLNGIGWYELSEDTLQQCYFIGFQIR